MANVSSTTVNNVTFMQPSPIPSRELQGFEVDASAGGIEMTTRRVPPSRATIALPAATACATTLFGSARYSASVKNFACAQLRLSSAMLPGRREAALGDQQRAHVEVIGVVREHALEVAAVPRRPPLRARTRGESLMAGMRRR
jgi:hypothetical protein